MTDGIIIAVIGAAGGVLVAFINVKFANLSKKVNGRMDELLEITRKSSNSDGNKEGRAELKQEQKDEKSKN